MQKFARKTKFAAFLRCVKSAQRHHAEILLHSGPEPASHGTEHTGIVPVTAALWPCILRGCYDIMTAQPQRKTWPVMFSLTRKLIQSRSAQTPTGTPETHRKTRPRNRARRRFTNRPPVGAYGGAAGAALAETRRAHHPLPTLLAASPPPSPRPGPRLTGPAALPRPAPL